MSQKFIQGQINHLTWVAVDATDFATPESALSAATKIYIYGTLNGNSQATFFVSSGTGSMAASGRDITHVGPSATGVYTVALGGAQLSDASAAFYDTYIIHISDIGAAMARQTLIIDGERTDTSYISNILSYLSNIGSYLSNFASNVSGVVSDIRSGTSDTNSKLVVMSGILSDVYSAVSNYGSNASNYLSYISGVVSGLGAGQSASAIAAKVWSDYGSKVGATPSQVYSVMLIDSSRISDIQSYLILMSGMLSDTYSAANATGATASAIADKVWSDYGSKVGATPSQAYSVALIGASAASDAASAAQQANSRILLVQSRLSELNSAYTSDISDVMSRISDVQSYLVLMSAMLSNVHSGVSQLESRVTAVVPTASDIASKVWAEKWDTNSVASSFGSLMEVMSSRISDTQSYLVAMSGMLSDAHSAAILGASHASDAASAATVLLSRTVSNLTRVSQIDSGVDVLQSRITAVVATGSDIASKVWAEKWDTNSVASSFGSMFELMSSRVSAAAAGASPSAIWAYGYSNLTVASSVGSMVRAGMSTVSGIRSATVSNLTRINQIDSGVDQLQSRTVSNLQRLSQVDSGVDVLQTLTAGISDTISKMGGPEHIASLVWDADKGLYVDASGMGSVLQTVGTAGVVASDISKTASAVWAAKWDTNSVASSFGSMFELMASRVSAAAGAASPSAIWGYGYSDLTEASSIGSILRAGLSTVSGIRSATVSNLTRLNQVDSGVDQLQSRTVSAINRISQIDSGVDQLQSRTVSMMARVSQIDSGVDVTQSALVSNLTRLNQVDSGVDQLQSRTASLMSQLSDIDSGVDVTQSALVSNLTRLNQVDSGVDQLQSRTVSMMGRLSQVDSGVDIIQGSQFTYLSGTLSNLDSQISAATSDILSSTRGNSDMISDLHSRIIANRGEPTQGNPPATTDALTKLDYLYKAWRNKKLNTGTETQLYNDNTTTIDQKQATTVAGGSVTVGEWTTGP